MEPGSTPLQRAFNEENVLRVNFEDIGKNDHVIRNRYHALAKGGILCGLKRFVFYGTLIFPLLFCKMQESSCL